MPKPLTEESEPVNVLYYGDGGTGKTTDIAHMAKLGPVIIINAESGIKTRALRQYDIPLDNISIYPDVEAGEEISFDGLIDLWKNTRAQLVESPGSVVGIGWDSVTEIYQALLLDIVKDAYIRAQRQGKDRDPSFIALEDYGVMTQQVRNLVRKFRDLECHFAMSALAKRDQDNDGQVIYQPQVTAKLQNDLIGWMDVVCVTQVVEYPDGGDDEYRGLFRPTGKWRGKDRFKMLPRGIVDPSFDRIVGYIEGDLEAETDPIMIAAKERASAVAQMIEDNVPA